MRFNNLCWPGSLRSRLLAVYGLSMAFSALLVGALVILMAKPFDSYALQRGMGHAAEKLAEWVRFGDDGVPEGFSEHEIKSWMLTSLGEEMQLRITDAAGRVVFAPNGETQALEQNDHGFDPELKAFAYERGGVVMRAGTAALTHEGRTWYVQLAISDRMVDWLRESVGLPALWRGMVAIGVVFLVVFLISTHRTLQRMLRPLGVAAQDAQRITPQTLDTRLQAKDLPREFAPLVEAFNLVLDRLQAGFRNQQEFLSMAAHELKTPLALMRAQIELEPDAGGRPNPLLQDVDHMARQVQQLLHLAEVSEHRQYRIGDVEAAGAVAEACGYMSRASEQCGIRICAEVDAGAQVWRADRGALFILLKNLIENAMQHSPGGSTVTVRAFGHGFSVVDQGCGVPAADLDRIFQRFWRSSERRDVGAGLGLPICLEIARAHGWTMQALPGAVGLELCVRFGGGEGSLTPPARPS
ncbi:MAG: HAMP domain-containing histidine kinase [Burkholderiaceae bacterium]|jgi:signal transduction histidine kinase|nr:HAMP domain-containing histidine kinase [Burkholderiaceae bacterium]